MRIKQNITDDEAHVFIESAMSLLRLLAELGIKSSCGKDSDDDALLPGAVCGMYYDDEADGFTWILNEEE